MNAEYRNFYNTLGLTPGASPAEIKRAYFSLLRQFRPEQDPEGFKRIRAAYEALKDGPPPEGDGFPRPDEPVIQFRIDDGLRDLRNGNYKAASEAFESILTILPDDPYILLHLAQAQKLDNHPQKAARTAQKLSKLHPDSREAAALGAAALLERGWFEKAWPAFERAYALGERSAPFLHAYVFAALKKGLWDEAVGIAEELLQNTKWTRENLELAIDAFYILAEHSTRTDNVSRILQTYETFLREHRRLLPDSIQIVAPVLAFLSQYDASEFTASAIPAKLREQLDSILAFISGVNEDLAEQVLELRLRFLYDAIRADERLTGTDWVLLFEAAFLVPKDEDEEVRRFARLDAELCVLKNPENLKALPILRKEYPLFYEANQLFLDRMEAGETEELFAARKREFLKLYKHFNGSEFFDKYPDEQPVVRRPVMVHGGEQPYVRDGKKIGRNDPCPCGSGKKFKRCCMGKGIYD